MSRRSGQAITILFCFLLGFTTSAAGQEEPKKGKRASWTAEIIPKPGSASKLIITERRIPVTLMPSNGKLRPLVEIRGLYDRPGWDLQAQGNSLLGKLSNKTEFKLYIYLTARYTELALTAKGPAGETESELISIYAPEAQEYRIAPPWGELLFSAGATLFSYAQTGFSDFNSTTGLISLHYQTPKLPWRLGLFADAKMTFLTFHSKPADMNPQIIQAKLDATFTLSDQPEQKFRTTLLLGGNYLTLLSNGSPFGFANLAAPDLGIRTQYRLGPSSNVVGDLRLVPLGGLKIFTERGLDISLGWTKTLQNLHRVQIDLGLSSFSYQPDPETIIKTKVISITFGYTI